MEKWVIVIQMFVIWGLYHHIRHLKSNKPNKPKFRTYNEYATYVRDNPNCTDTFGILTPDDVREPR